MKLVHKGSTKDVYLSGENYLFIFSDRYSVFDWGEMPDQLKDKGVALATFTKEVYRRLELAGIRTHLLNVACEENEIIVKPYEVIRHVTPMPRKENIFIPLEVIFRLGVAKGSSLLKRSQFFKELDRFAGPMIEFTTKLERFDRPLTHQEAKDLSGMNTDEWRDLLEITERIANELEVLFAAHGIELWDGKVEFALGEMIDGKREIILVDSIGPDELRLTKDGVHLSKEIIRQFYRNGPWYERLEEVKAQFGTGFKEHIQSPEKLPVTFQQSVEAMYSLLPKLITNTPGASHQLNELLPFLKEGSP